VGFGVSFTTESTADCSKPVVEDCCADDCGAACGVTAVAVCCDRNLSSLKLKVLSRRNWHREKIQKIQSNQSIHDVRLGNVEGMQEIQVS
jgi:hypothetical protein